MVLIGMHFLTLELGARIFGMLNAGIGVYRPNNNALLDWLQTRGRLRSNKTMLDRYDLKGMIRALKQNEILWYALTTIMAKRIACLCRFCRPGRRDNCRELHAGEKCQTGRDPVCTAQKSRRHRV